MPDTPPEPQVNLEARSLDERQQRMVAHPENDPIDLDKLGDTVRIERKPRAQTPDREMLKQPLQPD